jgi:ATP-binding cassette subfamily F protein uup
VGQPQGNAAANTDRQPSGGLDDRPAREQRRRLSYKERREMEQLEKDIAALEAEQKMLEQQLCSGTLTVAELTEKSKRLPQLKDELDEKSMRWLELSEVEG